MYRFVTISCSEITKTLLIVSAFLVFVSANNSTDFMLTNILPDGEIETRIRYRDISAKETTVSSRSDTKVTLRQLTDGTHFIQLIYDKHDNIRDCEYLHDRGQIETFLNKFRYDLNNLSTTSNITINHDIRLPTNITNWLDYGKLRLMCKKTHKAMRKAAQKSNSRSSIKGTHGNTRMRKSRSISEYFIAPGTLWCGPEHVANSYTNLGGMSQTDKCCRRHDHCKFNIHGFTKKFDYYNASPFTVSHCWCDNRNKRDITEMLQIPGTKWCGKGYSAKKYTHLGGFSRTDRCCRVHDTACPFWIGGFETKYGLFNWRVNTIMHCSCDDRFRACLKMADTSDANLVGKLFFNIVQTKCFILKPRKICLKRSWWGKCTKKKYMKQAVLRDNISY